MRGFSYIPGCFRFCNRLAALCTSFGLVPAIASAQWQWEVVLLEPDGVVASDALAGLGRFQGGRATLADGNERPAFWESSAASYGNLLPSAAWWGGRLTGVDLECQVGYVIGPSGVRASLWYGLPNSWISLHPGAPYLHSECRSVAGDQQVGIVYDGTSGMAHAALWHGLAATFVDLHSPLAVWSEALATDGERQAGRADIIAGGAGIHAVLWHGTAGSFADLHPDGASESAILGMHDGVQVGWALFGSQDHGVMWNGTAESAIDLHAPGARNSRIFATTGSKHAGYANFTGWGKAGIWVGDDPGNYVEIHQHLGPGWYSSRATSISNYRGRLYVTGGGARSGQPEQAVLWIGRRAATANPHLPNRVLDDAPPQR